MSTDSSSRLTRRGFVSLAGAAALAPLRWPGPRPTAPSDQIALGVIGVGIRGRNLMRGAFLPNDGFRVVAVCDVDTTRRDDGKRRVDSHYGNADCKTFVEHGDLLASGGVDAVVIATPDHWHGGQILDACLAKKDIYCEKPLTLTLRESQVVIDAVRKHEVVFQTGSQQRTEFGGRFVTACELVRNGRIGDVLTVHVGVGDSPRACDLPGETLEPGLDWDRWLGPAPERAYHSELSPRGVHSHYPRWRGYREYSGGYLADMGAHHFDIAQWGLRADTSGPVRVEPPVDLTATRGATLVYENGVRLVHGGPSGATFVGTGGVIHVDRGRLSSVPDKLLTDPLPDDAELLPRRPSHAVDWLECLRSRGRPVCDVEVGARSVAVCHLLNLAYWHRRALRWDPAAWRFVDDAEADGWRDYARRDGYGLPAV